MAVDEQIGVHIRPWHERSAEAVGRWWFDRPKILVICTGLIVTMALYGFRPAAHMMVLERIAVDPFTVSPIIPWTDHYLYESPIGPIAAWAIGLPNVYGFAIIQVAATVGVLWFCAAMIARWRSEVAARLFLAAYFCSPQAAIGSNYFGMLDVLVMGAGTIAMLGSAWAGVLGGVVLGVNHLAQGVIILCVVAAVRIFAWRERPAVMLYPALGVAIGQLVTLIYRTAADITLETSRFGTVLERGPVHWFEQWRGHLLVIVFSLYGVLWVPVLRAIGEVDLRTRWLLIGGHVALLGPVLVTYDATRVYSAITWPLLLVVVLWWSTVSTETLARVLGYLLAAAVFVPRIILWTDTVVVSRWDR